MGFSDPTPPPTIASPPMFGEGGGYWAAFSSEQQQSYQNQQSNSISQFDQFYTYHNQNPNPPFKRLKPSEKPPNYSQPNRPSNPLTIPGNRGTSHIFYKTRICAKFIEGTCRNGEHCTFAHGPDDLREPPSNWQDLVREMEKDKGAAVGGGVAGGGGSGVGGVWGEERGLMHRMKICKKYFNGEECPYGDKCNFLHERGPQPPAKKVRVDPPGPGYGERESSAISIGLMADRGDPVGAWKTRMCSKWEMGQCRYGDRCHYAHGSSDLILCDGPEMGVIGGGGAISRKAVGSVHGGAPPANMAVGDGDGGGGEEKRSKWKLNKKINRIYADWLDDVSPPRGLPGTA
ncbi:zinc finger CCCH domain-containing protein 39-like [Andrographis paniculata]|uniref:zinc finger CCCH domain-containing protein 39-like n=1 Tax=Andrographis paniculata TaxID=175694 RepID=UPI0021E9090E|nr:zinc finger CCCH domain-containing protein 39-like [Andrographis paniculata]